jgi:hypothetical protein
MARSAVKLCLKCLDFVILFFLKLFIACSFVLKKEKLNHE